MGRRLGIAAVVAALWVGQAGCVLPVQPAPGGQGRLVDAESGQPVSGATVVVRYEAWYNDVLPDRELLGHREARSGPDGRFQVPALVRPGLSAWPMQRTQARVVGVMAEGYRCPSSRVLRSQTTLKLQPAADELDRRDSCRPVAARSGEATAYMESWRQLYQVGASRETRERQRDLDRLLAARSTFGFGQNCEGPVLDLALDPSGQRAALLVRREGLASRVDLLDLKGTARPQPVTEIEPGAHQRLAWTEPGELVLWEPSSQERQVISRSIFGEQGFEVIWKAQEGEAAPATTLSSNAAPSRPIEPGDLNDEGDSRWLGRAFSQRRDIDPVTGLGRDLLSVTQPDGLRREIQLPGEACGPRGRFGRAHYRIAADGGSGLDLRFVNGGCHAVRIDLDSGDWQVLDRVQEPAECREVRSVPAQHMHGALRGYMREVSAALEEAGADPATTYELYLDSDGGTRAVTRDLRGQEHSVQVPRFPLATPLRRIEISVAGRRPEPPPPVLPTPAALPGP